MRKIIFVIIAFTGILSAQNDNPEITAGEIQDHINYLASDALEGRMTGTPELYQAAEFLKKEFENYGLDPLFEGSYFQEFPFMEKLELSTENSLIIIDKNKNFETVENINSDFIPLSFTDNLTVSGSLIFGLWNILKRSKL